MSKIKLLLQIAKLIFAGRKVVNEVENSITTQLKPLQGEPIRGELLEVKVPDFWDKHKNKAWVVLLLLVGAAGGNVDELYKAIPDVHDVEGLRKEVKALRVDVDALRGTPPITKPNDDDFKVERPSK